MLSNIYFLILQVKYVKSGTENNFKDENKLSKQVMEMFGFRCRYTTHQGLAVSCKIFGKKWYGF